MCVLYWFQPIFMFTLKICRMNSANWSHHMFFSCFLCEIQGTISKTDWGCSLVTLVASPNRLGSVPRKRFKRLSSSCSWHFKGDFRWENWGLFLWMDVMDNYIPYLAGGFLHFCFWIFTPDPEGRVFPIWRGYFSNGLVQPPTIR